MKIKFTPFLLLVLGQAVITIILFFMKTQYVDMCEPYTFLNPFGWHPTKELCINVVSNVPHQNFYLMFDILVLTIVGYLFFKLIKLVKSKLSPNLKISPIVPILVIESVITFVFGNIKLGCGSPCDPHSYLNPFGILNRVGIGCAAVCDKDTLFPFYYLAFDITVITLVIYLVYRLIIRIRKKQ